MKKIILLFVSVLLLPTIAFAYGNQDTEASDGSITLEYWTHEDPNRTPMEEKLIEEFEASHPGVTIERQTYPSARFEEVVLTAFSANQGPDILNMNITDAYSYIANGYISPVNIEASGFDNIEMLKNFYIPNVMDPINYEGNYYGLPFELTSWSLYVNKKIFRDAGLNPERDYPKTWEEMIEVAEKISIREGDILTRRAFDFRYPGYLRMENMVKQLGGKLISDDGKTAIINDEAWLKFLSFMREWGPQGKNLGSPANKNARKLFNADNNDIAMCLSGMYQQGRIRADNEAFYNSGDWMVVPNPQFENRVKDFGTTYILQYHLVSGQSTSREQQLSWEFLGYLKDHADKYLETSNIIMPTKNLIASDAYKAVPFSEAFATDMETGSISYYGKGGARLNELMKAAVENVMFTDISLEKALAEFRAKAQELIEE